ncbi:hypothetical protein C5167_046956 [Papaver somniferum]|uniref:Histidine kinase/HSP90-like ATPase domain-containing protein n=1 Tax=Papaver somniferum TaxID=3469 RepID=A0A4Y7LF87_PAPSO|nr:hypothetical protein C5167_046956 [Papaver somniferum]
MDERIQADAEKSESDNLVDQPKIEDKLGVFPHGLSTDSEVVKREFESMLRKSLRKSTEKFEFLAEALDKIRLLVLTDKEILGESDDTKLEIPMKLDEEKKILPTRDRGIGMTKEDLIKNLETIAKSVTSAFLEKMQTSGDLNLIGQFGVGFLFCSSCCQLYRSH